MKTAAEAAAAAEQHNTQQHYCRSSSNPGNAAVVQAAAANAGAGGQWALTSRWATAGCDAARYLRLMRAQMKGKQHPHAAQPSRTQHLPLPAHCPLTCPFLKAAIPW